MPFKFLLITLFLFSSLHAEAKLEPCGAIISEPSPAVALSHAVADNIERRPGSPLRGYGILIGTMVGSAALTTYAASHLSTDFQFLSIFVSQVSTLGFYVLGAPILEPISSRFRKLAFGVRTPANLLGAPSDPQLEAMWFRTQGSYSLNAQMSRNITASFILSIKQNFYEAHRALTSDDPAYAADQVAEAAYRLKILFKDIPADDPSVAAAIHTAFTNHVRIDDEFVARVRGILRGLDADSDYEEVLKAWLKP